MAQSEPSIAIRNSFSASLPQLYPAEDRIINEATPLLSVELSMSDPDIKTREELIDEGDKVFNNITIMMTTLWRKQRT